MGVWGKIGVLYRVEGLVIRSLDYGEGNKIITIFTENYGKIGIMARGAKKMNSRHSAASQLFTYAEYVFYRVGNKLGNLNSAEIINSHRRLREDLLLSAYAAYITELTERLVAEQEASPWLYRQYQSALQQLDDGKDAQIIMHIYEMKMLRHAGYVPELDQCVSCGKTAEDVRHYSIRLGGGLCRTCASSHPDAEPIHDQVMKLLRLFTRVDLARLGKIEVKADNKVQLKAFMRTWLDTHLDVRLRSRDILEQMQMLE